MKNKKLKLLSSASAAAMALSFSPFVCAQTQSSAAGSYNQPTQTAAPGATNSNAEQPNSSAQFSESSTNSASNSLRIASKDESKHTAEKLAGKKIRGQDGSEIGTVKDFLVDPHSGEVRFAVVSTGGFIGVGDKLHLVPFRELQENDKGFTASMTKQQLDQAPAVNEEQFEENKVSMTAQDQQNSTSGAMESNAAGAGDLVRATKIKSHDVKANGTKIGSIEAVVIEPGSTDAVALLEPEKDVAGTKQKFLVPLNRFTISGEKNSDITTTLTRADFQAAGQYNATASASTTGANSNNAMASTSEQSQNVAADSTAGTTAPSALGQTSSTSNATEQAQTASNSTQTTSPLSEESSGNRSSMAVNQGSSISSQNTASSDQFGAGASQTGQSSGFAQNTPSSSTASSTSSLNEANSQSQSSGLAANESSSATSSTAPLSAIGSESEHSSVAQNSTASGSSTSSTDTNQFSAPGSQTGESAVASNQSNSSGSTGSVEANTSTPGLTPTGQTSADQNPQADPTLITAAQAIRHALDSDPEIGHADVTVAPQDGKIVLKGQVSSDSLKSQIEKKAQSAANGAQIDSQLKVQNQ